MFSASRYKFESISDMFLKNLVRRIDEYFETTLSIMLNGEEKPRAFPLKLGARQDVS